MGKAPRNAEYTKDYNRKAFLRLLRQGPLSRAEIARRTGLTRAAASLIAEELLAEGLIRETAATSTKLGRTPVPLILSEDAGFAVGVYLNRDGCTAGIVDLRGQVTAQCRLRIGDGKGEEKLAPLVDAIREMIKSRGIMRDRLVGVGISAPGPLDGESGQILNPPRFELWHNTRIGPMMEAALETPVYLENNASCLARYNLGKPEAMGSENFLLLLVDSGVGSGVVTSGNVLKGAGYFTSELGHTSIHYRGKRCACGNIGCLEAYAAIPNLLNGTGFASWQEVVDAQSSRLDAQSSRPDAQRLMKLEAEYLSAGIVTMTNLVSIDTVLLAGDLLYGAETFAPLLEHQVNAHSLRRDILPVRVWPSRATPGALIEAAADVAFDHYLMV